MSVQSSTFNTSHVMDNEIIKANDFEFAFEQLIQNVSKATQMLLESDQDFVINGKVIPDSGMNLKVSPIYGVCKSTGIPFGRTEETDETIGFSGSSSGRIDILEVKGDWQTYDNQQRAFNDPDTDTQTYQYVDTKKLMKPIYQIVEGVEGSGVAPESSAGWVKLAEISIRAGASSILESDIHNITADVAGMNNTDWTTEKNVTYNIGYISDVNARFRVQHKEDGTHANDCINQDSLDIGIGAKQINGNVLPVGGAVSIPTETIAATDSIFSVITKAAAMLTSLYNGYLQYGGVNNLKGEFSVSSIFENSALKKPISLVAAGDGTAIIKVDGNAVISIDANGKLSTNGYTASSNNHIVTKIVTDGLKSLIDGLDTRVTNIENTSDVTVYANGTLSSGTNGSSGTDSRYNVDSVVIYAATTTNITLSGTQTIDGQSPTNGSFILVKNQTNATENGIYQYSSSSSWTRHNDFLSPNTLKAKIFNVVNGTNNGGRMFYLPKVNFTNGSAFGSDDILFAEYFGSIAAKPYKIAVRDSGGNINAAVTSAGKLTTARKVYVKLGTASTSETKDFSGDTAIPVNGTLPVGNGGTGMTTASYKNAVVVGNADTVTNALRTIRTGNGAFYATAQDEAPLFGALPIAQGGTGKTTASDARTALGLGSAATQTAGSAKGNVPLINSSSGLGTTNNNIVVTDASGNLKASGTVIGTAAGYAASSFLGSSATAANSSGLEGKTYRETAFQGLYIETNTSALTGSSYTFSPTAPTGSTALAVGSVVRVTFRYALQSSTPLQLIKLNYGGREGQIVVSRNNTTVGVISHEFTGGEYSSTYKHKVWDGFTTLELMWANGTWLIMGNPVLCSYFSTTQSYSVYANGKIEQLGNGTTDSGTGINISFLIQFTNTNYTIIPTMGYSSNPDSSGYKKDTITTSSVRIGIDGGYGAGIPLRWLAIGY